MPIENNNSAGEIKKYYYRKCLKCESKIHIEHKYCVCGDDVGKNDIYETETNPNVEKRNLDISGFSCEKCCKCRYCASYGMKQINRAGYGGLQCKHKRDDIKCKCCELMIRNWQKYPNDVHKTITESLEAIARIINRRESGNPALVQSA